MGGGPFPPPNQGARGSIHPKFLEGFLLAHRPPREPDKVSGMFRANSERPIRLSGTREIGQWNGAALFLRTRGLERTPPPAPSSLDEEELVNQNQLAFRRFIFRSLHAGVPCVGYSIGENGVEKIFVRRNHNFLHFPPRISKYPRDSFSSHWAGVELQTREKTMNGDEPFVLELALNTALTLRLRRPVTSNRMGWTAPAV